MKRFLIFMFVVAIAVVGIGFYRGWWTGSSEKDAEGKTHYELTVNKDKISEDEKAALKNVQAVGQKVKDKVVGTTVKEAPATGQPTAAADKDAKDAGIVPAVQPGAKK